MPDDNASKKKHYAVVPEKVTVPAPEPLATPTKEAPPTVHPDLGTSVPDESPRAP